MKKAHPLIIEIFLNKMHIPYILSPWHNQDIDYSTGSIKSRINMGALFFDSLKVILKSLNYFNKT
jgi:hypothetical protein